MAKIKGKDVQDASIMSLIAVGGGGLLDSMLVTRVEFLDNLLANLPADLAGVSVRALVMGAVALLLWKMFAK